MTIETQTPRVVYIGNGTRGPFSLQDGSGNPIRLRTATDLVLWRYSSTTDEVGEQLVYAVDFTVINTDPDAATFTLTSVQPVLTSSQRIVATREQSVSQDLNLSLGGNFGAVSDMAQRDIVAEQIQELRRDVDRSIKPSWRSTVTPTLPIAPSTTKLLGHTSFDTFSHVDVADVSPTALVLGDGWRTRLGNDLPQFYLDDYYSTTWEAALDAANTAAAEAGGGIIYATGREEYAFTGQPGVLSAGVYVVGAPNYTRFKLPSGATTCSLLRWAGALGASCTLASNAATGAETIVLTGTSLSIDVGDVIRIQKTPGGSITLGLYTQLTRIEAKSESGGNTTVTLAEPLEFAVQTSDTYTIRELDTNVGGGASGIIFDGAGNSATEARGVYAVYCEGMYFDELGGENVDGGSPMDGTTVAGVVDLRTCYDTRGLNNLWAWRSGSANICALQFREMGPTSYGKLYLEQCYGFGYGWYDSTQQHVDSIIESGSYGRSGKMQCVLGCSVKSVRSAKARFTGFAFTEGSRGHVNYASYHPTDAQFYTVTSIVRASNVSTITFASSPFLSTGIQVVIAGATGADTFNGTFALTRVSDTVYTYANAGTNETAGGTITCQLIRSPSLWCNGTGVVAVFDVVDFRGVTNPAGDVHTGSTDSVRIGVMRTEGSFTPTYGGTAGAAAQGTGRHIFDVNGASVVPNGFTVTSGALTVSAGQLTVTNTGAVPARFFADNFNYVVTLGNAATSSTVGYNAQAKDSGGTNRSFIMQNAAGTARLNNDNNSDLEIIINGTTVGRFNAAGGLRIGSHDVLTVQGGAVLRSFTAANIAAVANAVNTTGKVAGLMVYDTTNNRIMISSGSAAASPWYVADASASVTPS